MAEKDVQLVIRARNAASKAIEAVADSLGDLNSASKATSQSAKQMGSLLGQLGSEFQRLNREVAGLTALGKVADQIGRAESAVKRLEGATRSSAEDFARLARETERAAAETARLRGETEALERSYKDQKAAVASARKEQTQANAELRKAETLQRRVTAQAERHKTNSPWSNAAESAVTFADAEVGRANASARQATATYADLNAELAQIVTRRKEVGAAAQAAVTNERQLSGETEKVAAATKANAASLQEARSGLDAIRETAATASTALGGVAVNQTQLAAATRKATEELQRSKAVIEGIGRYSTGGGGFASPKAAAAQQAQRAEMQRTLETWKTLESEAARLSRAMGQTNAPTQEQSEAFQRVVGAARAAKVEYEQLQAALAKLQGSTRGSFAALDQIDGGLKRIAASSGDLERTKSVLEAMSRFSTGAGGFTNPEAAAALRKQREEVERARVAYETLNDHAKRLAASMSSVVNPTEKETQALRESAQAARVAEAEYRKQLALLNQMPGALGRFNGVLSVFGDDSRKAMSLAQRLRGEVLSLATAYLGLYSAISQIGSVITSYQKLEAAQSRIGAVFKQNQGAIRNELLWLERQAGRLGIEFGVLADEYSKFAVAANAANYESESTRKIFLALAEAGRVNKLSADQMSGAFLALQQMISKGKVSSEELRRQLGDRLPGAFNIFADALGVTTAQLDKMLQQGEVFSSEETLLKFADELNKRFGPQLAASLQTTTTLIGQFWNEVFQAQLRVGEGGFIKAFNTLLKDMIGYFKSREGRDFFLSLGAALGTFTNVLGWLIRNIGTFAEIVKLLISYRVAMWVLGIAMAFRTQLVPAIGAAALGFTGMFASIRAGMATMTTAAAVANGLAAALGRIPQVALITGAVWLVSKVVGEWASGVDGVTSALDKHKQMMGEVISAYESAINKTDDWQSAIKGASVDQLNANFRKLRDELDGLKKDLTKAVPRDVLFRGIFETGGYDTATKINDIKGQFAKGEISARNYREELDKVYAGTVSDSARQYLETQLDLARRAEALEQAMRENSIAAKAMGSTLEDIDSSADGAAGSMRDLTKPVDDVAGKFGRAASAMNTFKEGLVSLQELVPDLAEGLDTKKELAEIDAIVKRTLDAMDKVRAAGGRTTPGQLQQVLETARRARAVALGEDEKTAFDEIAENTGLTAKAVADLRGTEGFRAQAYRNSPTDPWTIGYGHTGAAGGIQPVEGMIISKADALKQYGEDLEMFAKQVDDLVKVPLTEAMRSALVSLQYNSGGLGAADGRRLILDPLNKGDYVAAQQGISRFRTTGSGLDLTARRRKEAEEFGSQGFSNAEIEADRYEREAKIAAEKEKQKKQVKELIADNAFELSQLDLKAQGLKREAAIEAAIRDAKQKDPDIGKAELETIRQQAGALYDKQEALNEEKDQKKKIREIDRQIADLESARNSLLQQRKIYEVRGDDMAVDEVNKRLEDVNARLRENIDRAIAFWQAIGGSTADAAIAKLQATALELDNFQRKSKITGEAINESLGDGLVGAFDSFAQAIGNGENVLQSFFRAFQKFAADFLIEIGKMILRQAIFNALQQGSASGSGVGGFLSSAIGMLFHSGGVVGQSGPSRAIAPGWFSNAVRYHSGGIAGLKPGEIPAILQDGEEVLTQSDPRHVMNGGGAARPVIKVVNAFDAGSVISEGLNSAVGEETFINMVRANASTIREVLGG